MEQGRFYINGKTYLGYHNPDIKWNGWAVPCFSWAVSVQILNDQVPGKWVTEDDAFRLLGDEEEEEELWGITDWVDYTPMYSIGGFYWTWELVKD